MKKIFITIITTILLFAPKVSALSSTMESMGDVYYSMMIKDINDYYYNSDYQKYLRMNGELVYCLEPEKKYYGGMNYTIVDTINFNSNQIDKINLIGHYGYEYYGHQDYRYYLAAQELIWQASRPMIQMSWSTQLHGANNSYINIDKEKEEINYLVNNHLNKPYFDGTSIDVDYNETIILTDNLLRYFEVISKNTDVVKLEDNKLIIEKRTLDEQIVVLKKKIIYDDKVMTLYEANAFQSVIKARSSDEVISTFKIKEATGSVMISVVDGKTKSLEGRNGASLNETKYNLYDENMNLLKEVTLNGNPYKVDLLSEGNYKLKQVESGNGYVIDDDIYEFSIDKENLNIEVVFENDLLSANLEIEKYYGDNNLKEEGAVFEIENKDVKEQIVTNKNGVANINLEYGKYKISQINGVSNHYLIEPFNIMVRDDKKIEFTFFNKEIKANLKIRNIDYETKELIDSKSTIKIFSINKNEYFKVNGEDQFKAENGIITIDNLPLGNYYIEQVEKIEGYLKFENKYINLTNNLEIDIDNMIDYKNIKINCFGENESLNGAEFGLYSKDRISINNKYYESNELIEIITTINGQAITKNIPVGIYYVKQLKTSENYVLNSETYEIDLHDTDELNIKNMKKVTIKEDLKKEEDKSSNSSKEVTNNDKNSSEVRIDKMISIINELENEKQNPNQNLNTSYIAIPDTGINDIKETKLSMVGALIIILIGYVILKYAKE